MIILVTGATAGFGESITRRFVANGHKVIATGRRQERLQELKDELGDSILTAQLDVRNRAAIEESGFPGAAETLFRSKLFPERTGPRQSGRQEPTI